MRPVWLDEERIAAAPIRLHAGKHDSPWDGVCVMELASLIADEEFSDRPRCVCPVVGSFMRSWNDRAGYHERQRLEPYARRVVGSRAGRDVTRRRRELCLAYARTGLGGDSARGTQLGQRARIALFCGVGAGLKLNEGAGEFAARVAFAAGDRDGAFRLLEAMLALGGKPQARQPAAPAPELEAAPLAEPVASPPQVRVPAGIS
jgi:hypothetical protein